MTNKTALIILDGWGIGRPDGNNAVHVASTPCFDRLLADHPHATLTTHGEDVGLPTGQMGNSEVGHLNIGAGRIVYQDLLRIDRAVADGSIATEPVLQEALSGAKEAGRRRHFMGLVSRGGVHSQQDHLHALLRIAADAEVPDVVVHAFTDGRDTAPKLGAGYLEELEAVCAETGAGLAPSAAGTGRWTGTSGGSASPRPTTCWFEDRGTPFRMRQRPWPPLTLPRSPTSSWSPRSSTVWTAGSDRVMWCSASISARTGAGRLPQP